MRSGYYVSAKLHQRQKTGCDYVGILFLWNCVASCFILFWFENELRAKADLPDLDSAYLNLPTRDKYYTLTLGLF